MTRHGHTSLGKRLGELIGKILAAGFLAKFYGLRRPPYVEPEEPRVGPLPPPIHDCRAPSRECPRRASCARHNACEWETWQAVDPPRPGAV